VNGDCPTVVIAGGGASGTLLATQLIRRLHPGGLRVVLIDRTGAFGRGLAYSTPWETHRLNVPAGRMGAFPRDAEHFMRWAEAAEDAFLPRCEYGAYLSRVLCDAVARARPGVELVRVCDEVVDADVDANGVTVHLRDGAPIRADRMVLAFGNLPPGPAPGADPDLEVSGRYHGDPWDRDLTRLAAGESVLLIGSGLTMVDLALVLGRHSAPGALRAVSRTGQLPRAHRRFEREAHEPFELPDGAFTLDELIAEIDRRIGLAKATGGNWRGVVDSLRPITNVIWRRLPDADKHRFVTEVARHWEVRRHRMAPEVAAQLRTLREEGRLLVEQGNITALRPVADGVEVTRDGDTFTVDRVVNCTGPSLRVGLAGDPLLSSLLAAGHVRPGPFELGLDHDSRGALVGADGRPAGSVYGIGPVRKGHLWETTAIPEIRAQAFELADLLSAQLSARSVQALRAA
jgi:uncharacterized NAD(P)/FAD-binding protein YdhS